jgi:hypothetical protein
MSDETARLCLRGVRGGLTDAQYVDALDRIKAAIQDAFDSGFKAAGGSIAPNAVGGGPWQFVEITLTRDQIDILAAFADDVVGDKMDRNYDSAPILQDFLDKISIFRRKR